MCKVNWDCPFSGRNSFSLSERSAQSQHEHRGGNMGTGAIGPIIVILRK